MAADIRTCHAILWDVHGGLLDHKVDPQREAPKRRRQDWVDRVRGVLLEAGAQENDLMRDRLDPIKFWRKRMRCELELPKEKETSDGRVIIPERRFQTQVNATLLQWVAPFLMQGLSRKEKLRLARLVWRRRRGDQLEYVLDPRMRQVVHWFGEEGLMLCLITAQDRKRAMQLLGRCQVPMSLFTSVYTSGTIGLPKSHPAFWEEVRRRIKIPANQVVCIEDSPAIGRNALRCGMALLVYDPDGEIATFIQEELEGKLAGAPLLKVGDALPISDPFVLCPRNPKELQRCFYAMRMVCS